MVKRPVLVFVVPSVIDLPTCRRAHTCPRGSADLTARRHAAWRSGIWALPDDADAYVTTATAGAPNVNEVLSSTAIAAERGTNDDGRRARVQPVRESIPRQPFHREE